MDYILRNIRPELWVQVKETAALDGMTIRAVIIALLTGYVDRVVRLSSVAVRRRR